MTPKTLYGEKKESSGRKRVSWLNIKKTIRHIEHSLKGNMLPLKRER
jgi:hypothetical protein